MILLFFIYLDSKMEDKRFCTELQQAFSELNLLSISSWFEFWFVRVLTNNSTVSHCYSPDVDCHAQFSVWRYPLSPICIKIS
jgi:hypothetical protein